MQCEIIKDLIPLCIDGCCSAESEKTVKEHIETCDACRSLFEEMSAPACIAAEAGAPRKLTRIRDRKASVLQSVLLFLSFALITLGVTVEAGTPDGAANGRWAFALVVPATGFLLSLANWYFVKFYKSRRQFSLCSLLAAVVLTACGYVWAFIHYGLGLFAIENLRFGVICAVLTVAFCALSKVLSNRYAKLLGKE